MRSGASSASIYMGTCCPPLNLSRSHARKKFYLVTAYVEKKNVALARAREAKMVTTIATLTTSLILRHFRLGKM